MIVSQYGLPRYRNARQRRDARCPGINSREVQGILRDCNGQDLAEYAMLISLITLALIAALTLIGSRITAMFTAVAGSF